MHFSLVYFPDVGVDTLNRIRRKYDPTFELVPPHVTIIFPVPESVGEARLLEHIKTILRGSRAFPVRFRGFEKSPDHWLFLKVQDGKVEFVQLFESMHTGPLAEFRRADVTFLPHVGLGLFVRKDVQYDMFAAPRADDLDESSYRQALKEAEAEHIDLRTNVSTLHLVQLEDDVLDWARGVRRELPSGARVRTMAQFDLPAGV
jgi:2'-5' RNA ligase